MCSDQSLAFVKPKPGKPVCGVYTYGMGRYRFIQSKCEAVKLQNVQEDFYLCRTTTPSALYMKKIRAVLNVTTSDNAILSIKTSSATR